MDSDQFCKMLKEARKLTGVRVFDICYQLKKTESAIRYFLCGKSDNTMPKVFAYLNAINCELLIQNGDKTIILNSDKALQDWVLPVLSTASQREFAEIFGVSHPTIGSILKGGAIRQSLFLKFVDYTGSQVYIQPIESMPIDDVSDCDVEL